jgi:hypothetical protein
LTSAACFAVEIARSAIKSPWTLAALTVLSELQMALVRRASALCILWELTEIELAQGSKPDIQEYLTTVNVLRRVSASLGLSRIPRDTP